MVVKPVEGAGYADCRTLCVWLGICGVVSVVLPAEPLTLTEPEGVCDANAVVKATEPPVLAVPVTRRKALLSLVVVIFVQPVGALVCANSMTVLEGNSAVAAVVCVVESPKVMPAEVSIAI